MNVKIGNLIKVTGKNVFCKTIAGNYGIIIEKLTNEEFKVIIQGQPNAPYFLYQHEFTVISERFHEI